MIKNALATRVRALFNKVAYGLTKAAQEPGNEKEARRRAVCKRGNGK